MSTPCTICKLRNAVYARSYSGENLCARCFCRSIEKKVRATVAKHNLLRFDDKIAVAVSGGKDSIALLHIISKLEKSFPKAKLTAITVDEGIDRYRDEALSIATRSCQKLKINHVVASFKELFGYELDELVKRLPTLKTKHANLTPCSYCGVLRRRALNLLAMRCGATKLATGHNLDDEAQTVLLNLFHGAPLRITRARPASPESSSGTPFVQRIKPLCEILEKEAALYAYLEGLEFQNKECPYAGEALRNDMRFMLNRLEEKHPGMKYTVYHSGQKLRIPSGESVEWADLKTCKVCGEPAMATLCQPCKMLQMLGAEKS
ncbi:MAG: TIGR00269 family protein [Candidatus Bathyarchaeota archaeon]|nr:TIGR00269 family protein [Candidatus Bathyarchaeota archaeon]